MKFHERLKLVRKSRGKTQQFMADNLEINIRHYQKYESGEVWPMLDKLVKIADLLDCSTDYLLCRDQWLEYHEDHGKSS